MVDLMTSYRTMVFGVVTVVCAMTPGIASADSVPAVFKKVIVAKPTQSAPAFNLGSIRDLIAGGGIFTVMNSILFLGPSR